VGAGKRIPEQGHSYILPATFASLDSGGDVNQAQHIAVHHPKVVECYILDVQTTDDVVMIPMPQTANDGALLKEFLRLVERSLAPRDQRTIGDGFVLRSNSQAATTPPRPRKVSFSPIAKALASTPFAFNWFSWSLFVRFRLIHPPKFLPEKTQQQQIDTPTSWPDGLPSVLLMQELFTEFFVKWHSMLPCLHQQRTIEHVVSGGHLTFAITLTFAILAVAGYHHQDPGVT
jgi:hypothetical protein